MLEAATASWLRQLAERDSDAVLDRMHALAAERDFPIVGPEVGRLLAQLARLSSAQRIFEMGSGFGYSTLWFARALGEDGRIYHTDGDPENQRLARRFLGEAGVAQRVEFLCGDARELIAQTPGAFDIVFCDIDKAQYPSAYDLFADRVRVGGLVIIDNLIWSGRVAAGDDSAESRGIRDYVDKMWNDSRYLSSLMPVRDGVGVSLRVA
ncbi:MAG: O-methyltransferase [Deltaproteobacteria bacterium]|nr:O-methyltransferase [Deltaproteobacteria bacterium]